MKYSKTLVLAMLLGFSTLNLATAQSEEEDPLTGFDDLFEAIEQIEEEGTSMEAGGETSETMETVESTETTETTETTTEVEVTSETSTETVTDNRQKIGSRLFPKEIPAGKETHILYTIPGAIAFRGMTFMQIDSALFFNKFQKCDTPETDVVTNKLARLKISQGAPLECRESMKYQFAPYRTYRANR